MAHTQRKMMSFPIQLVSIIEKNASRLGMGFTEYVRHILAKEAENTLEGEVHYMSERTERAWDNFKTAKKEGKTRIYKTPDDLMNSLLS